MYIPQAFQEDRLEVQYELIRNHPFGLLILADENGPIAIPLPFHLTRGQNAEPDILQGHLARANPDWKTLDGQDVLIVFNGPQAYVTPSWYVSKVEHGKVVPTWNYAMVQVRGTARLIDDGDWLYKQIINLTNDQEAGRATPWRVTDAPDDFISSQLKHIIGIEITIHKIEGKWKASQNQPIPNCLGVINGFIADGREDMAQLVQKHNAHRL